MIFDILKQILLNYLRGIKNLVICDGLKLRLTQYWENLKPESIAERRIIETAEENDYIEYKFLFGNPVSALLATLTSPKFLTLTKDNIEYFM